MPAVQERVRQQPPLHLGRRHRQQQVPAAHGDTGFMPSIAASATRCCSDMTVALTDGLAPIRSSNQPRSARVIAR
jgi:hypothetical protein